MKARRYEGGHRMEGFPSCRESSVRFKCASVLLFCPSALHAFILPMRSVELDAILGAMLQSYDGISDLNFSVGRPLQVEAFGQLKPIAVDPPIDSLTSYQTENIALNLMGNNRRLIEPPARNRLVRLRLPTRHAGALPREHLPSAGPLFGGHAQAQLGHPHARQPGPARRSSRNQIAREKTGLVLVTGATGSGKTTTLAAVLNEINRTQAYHIITLEDPVEFVHPHYQSTFNQRELGSDFNTYPNGLRAALRQAPKVILVGEMRDRETVEIAMTAAETGHLVLSTLHTIDAGQSINRILGSVRAGRRKTRAPASRRHAALRGQPAARAASARRAATPHGGDGQQPAHEGSHRARRGGRPQLLRHHRGERDLRLVHLRPVDHQSLRVRHGGRGNGAAASPRTKARSSARWTSSRRAAARRRTKSAACVWTPLLQPVLSRKDEG